ncbi:Hypothetical predicted protein, partial [Podarcis lilfordi]
MTGESCDKLNVMVVVIPPGWPSPEVSDDEQIGSLSRQRQGWRGGQQTSRQRSPCRFG